ncbi:MAG: phosphatase PAP2 family protein [Mycobacterium sp.]|nr:phosphatase PAP2 family protein [Mycobacterium sp.]
MQASHFGVVGLGLSVALAMLAGAATWMARRPQLRGWPDLAAIGRLRRWCSANFGELVSMARDRLGRDWSAVLALMAGLVSVMVFAVGFTALLDDALEGDGFARIDEPAAQWLATHREGWLNNSLTLITHLGDAPTQALWLTIVCAVAAWRAHSWLPVILGLVGGVGIAVIIATSKTLVGRQRPDPPFALVNSHGFSFPSGHAAGAAAVGLLSAWMLCRWVVRPWAGQVAVWALTLAVVGLIGFSRLYLGVHFVTDVLAGWLLGAAWAGAVVNVTAWWYRPTPIRPLRN